MGSSILTNRSAMTALQTLKTIGNNLDKTQERVSTGLEINGASDNVAYWSISSMMKSDSSTLSAVSKALDLGKGQVELAEQTVETSKTALDSINGTLTTAYEKGEGDVQKIQADLKSSVATIKSSVYSATLAEKNIVADSGNSVRVAGSYRREGANVYVDMIDVGGKELNFATKNNDGSYDLSKGQLSEVFGELDVKDGSTAGATIKGLATAVVAAQEAYDKAAAADKATAKSALDDAKTALDKVSINDFANADFTADDSKLTSDELEVLVQSLQSGTTTATQNVVAAGAALGASKAQIESQIDYVGKLVDSIDTGVGALVDADMNAESARLSALQTQQQLGIQALSIANQNSQNILSLFQ